MTIDNRVEALARQWLFERGAELFVRRARLSPVVVQFEQHSVEALGNPLLRATRVDRTLAAREVTIAEADTWREFGSGRSIRHSRFEEDDTVAWLEDTLLPWSRKREAEGNPALPSSFEEFRALVEEALGSRTGDGKPGAARDSGLGTEGLGIGAPVSGLGFHRTPEVRTSK